jgi:hypothetical protein
VSPSASMSEVRMEISAMVRAIINELCDVLVVNVDVLGPVRCHRIVRKLDSAFVVFIHGSGSTLATVSVFEQLPELKCALGCTHEGDILGLSGRSSCCLEVQLIVPPLSMTPSLDWERRVIVSLAHSQSEKTITVVRRWGAHEPFVRLEECVPLK